MKPQWPKISWSGIKRIYARTLSCGYCGKAISSDKGLMGVSFKLPDSYLYLCNNCSQPTYFDMVGNQIPHPVFGNPTDHAPKSIQDIYNEARHCISNNAVIASMLCARRAIVAIAQAKGYKDGYDFVNALDFLLKNGMVPQDRREWIEHIKIENDEKSHKLSDLVKKDSEEMITLAETLIKHNF